MTTKKILIIIIGVIITGCTQLPNLGKGYKLIRDGNSDIVIINSRNAFVVEGVILNYNFDSVFILVEQKPKNLILKDVLYKPENDYPTIEKIFNKSRFRQYWIINKVIDSVYGPYPKAEYLKKCKNLKVPEGLKLEFGS